LENSFKDLIKTEHVFKTPLAPRTVIMRPDPDDPTIIARSGVGMLLYMIKHSRPDLANAVRELSKVLDEQQRHIGRL
jgi:hypothetical protein